MLANRLFKVFLFSVLISGGLTVGFAQTPTYAERLGWAPGTRAVILHMDDAGRSHSSNLGTIKAIEDGLGVSTSIMMPRPGAQEFVEYVKSHPNVDAGLHLDLTRGAPADQAETEIRNQIDKALSMGIKPTHLDGEGAMQFNTQYTDRFVKVALEKKIPLLFYGGHMQYINAEAGSNKELFLSIAQKLWGAGVPVIDDVMAQRSHAENYEDRKADLIKRLREMKPGITEIIFHCSIKTDDPQSDSAPGQDMGREGEMDVRLLTDPEIKAFIKSEGIVLTSWRELMTRRTRVKN